MKRRVLTRLLVPMAMVAAITACTRHRVLPTQAVVNVVGDSARCFWRAPLRVVVCSIYKQGRVYFDTSGVGEGRQPPIDTTSGS